MVVSVEPSVVMTPTSAEVPVALAVTVSVELAEAESPLSVPPGAEVAPEAWERMEPAELAGVGAPVLAVEV